LFRNIPTFTKKVDIFAIGCIIFEFMTGGRRAFGGDMEVLIYAAGGTQLDFSHPRFRTTASAFLEALTRQLLDVQVQERPSAKALLQKLSGLPATRIKVGGTDGQYSWVVLDDGELRHVKRIASGASGEVHEVVSLYLRSC
jgi:serine/threonine protein kinase